MNELISDKDQRLVEFIRSKINLPNWSMTMAVRAYLQGEETDIFKIWVTYDQNINDVAIHLDKDTARDLIVYLGRSVLMDFEYKDGEVKVVGCYNAIPVEAACGNKGAQHMMDLRNKIIELVDRAINKKEA
jgi:hypothetical protein